MERTCRAKHAHQISRVRLQPEGRSKSSSLFRLGTYTMDGQERKNLSRSRCVDARGVDGPRIAARRDRATRARQPRAPSSPAAAMRLRVTGGRKAETAMESGAQRYAPRAWCSARRLPPDTRWRLGGLGHCRAGVFSAQHAEMQQRSSCMKISPVVYSISRKWTRDSAIP